jgi:RimJ/RimL family protein N-acetyltransferase
MRVLQTDRLTLRWFSEGDAAFILELLNEPSWIANIGDRGVRTLEQARAWIGEKLVASYWDKGFGLWAVERKGDGALVGMCGLIERDTLTAIDVGYALSPRHWGNGYAREATVASLDYARDVLGRPRVLAIVLPENRASIRVLETAGMTRAGTHRAETEELALFAIGAEPEGRGDAAAEIDALVRRFFAAFSNRQGMARIASVPSMFLPEATITVVKPAAPRGVEAMSVRDFVTPRAELLLEGRLTGFDEVEIGSRTDVVGALAQRSSRYQKSGVLDGAAFEGGGSKQFQLVKTRRGWKIASLTWEDAAN